MEFGLSIPTLLGSIVIVAALVWFARAVLRRLVGRQKETDDDFT